MLKAWLIELVEHIFAIQTRKNKNHGKYNQIHTNNRFYRNAFIIYFSK